MIWDKFIERGTLNNVDSKYLYRGLRKEEIDAGFRLIPKGIQTFEGPKLVVAKPSGVYGFENAGPGMSVSNHINGRQPTSGISTSTKK